MAVLSAQVACSDTSANGVDGSSAGGDGGGATADASSLPRADARQYTSIVVDHTSIALFDDIPEEYLQAAREMTMMFSDRSVGQNIHESLDCLTADGWAASPSSCRRDYVDGSFEEHRTFTQTDLDAGQVPARIQFPADPVLYDRDGWVFEPKSGSWSELTQDFIEVLAPAHLDKDVLSYQFSYLNVGTDSNIDDSAVGFFADTDAYDIHDLEAFVAEHPDKVFFLWTTSLARAIGTSQSTTFNSQMRDYAAAHEKILFDVADIEAHTDLGAPCFDVNTDDGADYPAICQDYTTEPIGGHLGSVSAGRIQIAKGYWVLMAQIAGWQP